MNLTLIYTIFLCIVSNVSKAQIPFILSIEQNESDYISDVVPVSTEFYFLQNRLINLESIFEEDWDIDGYSDLIRTSADGSIKEVINLNGFRTRYHRIIKSDGESLYLVGVIKSDSCLSSLVISKFNINTRELIHLTSYDVCESLIQNIVIAKGLNGEVFIEGYYFKEFGLVKFILNWKTTSILIPVFEQLHYSVTLSIDFARKGYVVAIAKLYNFYDSEFNYRKQRFTGENVDGPHQTHISFGNHYILQQVVQQSGSYPDAGMQVRLVDSNLVIKKKALIYPNHSRFGSTHLPFYRGIDIRNENEIWATATYGREAFNDSSFFSITKLDSNLQIICQHFIGYDSWYRIYGIKALESGGAIVYGNRVREGYGQNSGEDIFAMRVGSDCELPASELYTDPFTAISVYPNPGSNEMQVKVTGLEARDLRMELINELGQVVFQIQDLSSVIQIPNIPSGQYYYKVISGSKQIGVGPWIKI